MSKRFKVGQEVVRVRLHPYTAAMSFDTMIVSKVGTKWVEAHRGDERFPERFDGKTGRGTTFRDKEINRLYESREVFEKAQRAEVELKNFYRSVSSYSFRNELELIPIENVRAAAKLLGIKLEKGE